MVFAVLRETGITFVFSGGRLSRYPYTAATIAPVWAAVILLVLAIEFLVWLITTFQ